MIRPARRADLDLIVALAARRRLEYEAYQPQFWRVSPAAEPRHREFLAALIEDEAWGCFVSEHITVAGGAAGKAAVPAAAGEALSVAGGAAGKSAGELGGYLFCRLVPAPPVYDPGGPSCFVDDFAVAEHGLWLSDGRELLSAAASWGSARGAAQLVVVNAERDAPKAELLAAFGLSIASTWSVGSLLQVPERGQG